MLRRKCKKRMPITKNQFEEIIIDYCNYGANNAHKNEKKSVLYDQVQWRVTMKDY